MTGGTWCSVAAPAAGVAWCQREQLHLGYALVVTVRRSDAWIVPGSYRIEAPDSDRGRAHALSRPVLRHLGQNKNFGLSWDSTVLQAPPAPNLCRAFCCGGALSSSGVGMSAALCLVIVVAPQVPASVAKK